jgi:hypothetical protein
LTGRFDISNNVAMLTENELREWALKAENRAEIAREARVNYIWLHNFAHGKTKKPRKHNIERLRTYREAAQQ